MPEPQNVANQLLTYQALNFTPQQQKNLMAAQQQQALAQALLQQGETPISTEGRSIGGVGYNISPWEGVAKLGQALSGNLSQQAANEKLVNALMPSDGSSPGGGMPDFYDKSGQLTPFGKLQIFNGNRAVAEMRPPNEVRTAQYALGDQAPGVIGQQLQNQANPGAVTYQQELGKGAAALAPAGQPPNGMAGSAPPPQLAPQPPITPVEGSQGIPPINASQLQGPAPTGPVPPPPPAGAFQPPSPAGLTNEGYKAALEVSKGAANVANKSQVEQKTKSQDILAGTAGVNENFDKLEQLIKSYPTSAIAPLEAKLANVPGVDPAPAVAKAQMDQMVNATLLPQIKTMLQGTGQVRVPEIEFLKELHNINFGNKPEVNLGILNNLRTMVSNESTAALAKAGYNANSGQPTAPQMQAYPTGQMPSAQALVDELRSRGHEIK